MPSIEAHSGVVTQVNVFTTTPEHQQALINVLIESARLASTVPGWRSASIHRELDGTRVVNYAQTDDRAAADAVVTLLRDRGWLARNSALGTAHPGLYSCVFTLER